MKAKITTCPINGVFIIESSVFTDERGIFIKTFHENFFMGSHFNTFFKEEYYSVSNKNVIRGMHFQTPPFAHEKIVYCVNGKILDVILDLRKESPTYKKSFSVELNGSDGKIIYIPKGLAHGFCALIDNSIMMYKVSTVYCQNNDCGVRWDSFNFTWPVEKPIISSRDLSFPPLETFNNPF